jgi:plastocyanin domain-containing protein
MRTAALLFPLLVALMTSSPAHACQDCDQEGVALHPSPVEAAQVLSVQITEAGIVPRELKVKAGVPVKLRVSRLTEKHCAASFAVRGYTIEVSLPLGQTLEIEFTVAKKGKVTFGCGKRPTAGTLLVE